MTKPAQNRSPKPRNAYSRAVRRTWEAVMKERGTGKACPPLLAQPRGFDKAFPQKA
jgi:hypothetical protein